MNRFLLALTMMLALACAPRDSFALAISLGFDSFFYEPAAPVSVAADGASATLAEDPFLIGYLSNVPVLGDPEIIVGGIGRSLVLDYAFSEPTGNTDIFHVALLDGATGNVLDPAFDVFISEPGSGQVTFDLSTFGSVLLGLQLELLPDLATDADFSSLVQLTGLRLNVPDEPPPVDVPEPSSSSLAVLGCLLLLLSRVTRARRGQD